MIKDLQQNQILTKKQYTIQYAFGNSPHMIKQCYPFLKDNPPTLYGIRLDLPI